MFFLLGLQSLSESKSLLNPSFVGGGNGVESASEDGIIVGVNFGQRDNCFINFFLDDLIVGQLLSKHCHLCFERTHFFLIIGFCFVILPFDEIQLFPQHFVFQLMGIQITQSFLINAIDSLQLFSPNFELNPGFGQISVKLSLEIPCIDHQLFMLFVFLS